MLFMLLNCIGIHKDVVQVDVHTPSNHVTEYCGHKPLERCSGITIPNPHYMAYKCSHNGGECIFFNVFNTYLDLFICICQIDLGFNILPGLHLSGWLPGLVKVLHPLLYYHSVVVHQWESSISHLSWEYIALEQPGLWTLVPTILPWHSGWSLHVIYPTGSPDNGV